MPYQATYILLTAVCQSTEASTGIAKSLLQNVRSAVVVIYHTAVGLVPSTPYTIVVNGINKCFSILYRSCSYLKTLPYIDCRSDRPISNTHDIL